MLQLKISFIKLHTAILYKAIYKSEILFFILNNFNDINNCYICFFLNKKIVLIMINFKILFYIS